MLVALESVDGVCILAESTATRFLAAAQPDIYVKGGDHTLDTLNQAEHRTVEEADGKIVITLFVPGKSTAAVLKKIMRLCKPRQGPALAHSAPNAKSQQDGASPLRLTE